MAQRGGPDSRSKNLIFSVACILGCWASPGVARAQDEAAEPATPAESSDAAADADSDAASAEDSASTAEEPATEEDAPSEGSATEGSATEGTDDVAAPAPETPSSDDAVEPLDESSSPEEEQPDYFGGLEPSSPVYQLEDPTIPEKPRYDGPFRAGAIRFGLGVGGGSYGEETYFLLGFGLGYFLVNGLELHVDTDFWLIGDPFIASPSPGLRYVMWFVPKVHPYVGAFYRHYFAGDGYPDANSIGARGGVYLMTGRSSYFGLGVGYEHMLDQELFVDTDFIYPEIAFAFAF